MEQKEKNDEPSDEELVTLLNAFPVDSRPRRKELVSISRCRGHAGSMIPKTSWRAVMTPPAQEKGAAMIFFFFSNLMEKYQPVVEDVAAVVQSVGGSKELNEFRPIAATLRERIRRFPWTQAIYLKKY